MNIALLLIDSRGGVQPYIALALGLKRAGHEVRVIAPSGYMAMIERWGLDARPLSGDIEALIRGSGAVTERGTLASIRFGIEQLRRYVAAWTREAEAACRGVDLIAAGIGGEAIALALAEHLGVPFIEAHLHPVGASASTFPGLLASWMPDWLGAPGRSVSHRITGLALGVPRLLMTTVARSVLRLPGMSRRVRASTAVYGYSRHVLPAVPEWRGQRHVTGYWQLPAHTGWRPSPALEAFVNAKGPVVCVGFGSMVNSDPRAQAAMVREAVRRAGVRAVLLTGWGGLEGETRDDLFYADSVPHDWLFPRMRAIVHHGGAGTTGAALRAGVPALIIPFTMDQPFWGARIAALGVGPRPIPRPKLDVDNLSAGLVQLVSDPMMAARAAALGKRIAAEDGIAEAVRHFGRFGPSTARVRDLTREATLRREQRELDSQTA
jgi:sterol 3beta-glucosyltransferase